MRKLAINWETFIIDKADVSHCLGQHSNLIHVCDVTLNWQLKSNLPLESSMKMNPSQLRVFRVERVLRDSSSIV